MRLRDQEHTRGMLLNGSEKAWPLQRLVQMLNHTLAKEKESWKESPLSLPKSMNDIGPEYRNRITEWMAQLTIQFHFHPETFFLASSILDRFITSVKAQPKYLKCIAITCFYIASKISEEEDVVPCTGELVGDSNCGFRVCDVLRMERIILEKLSWDILSPTPLDYLHMFQVLAFIHYSDLSSSLSLPHLMGMMTNSLIHALCRYEVARFPNAAIALALVSLNLESVTSNPGKWTSITGQLQALAKVKTNDLMKCRQVLIQCLPNTDVTCRIRLYSPSPFPGSQKLMPSRTKVIHASNSAAIKRKATPELMHCTSEKKIHATCTEDMEFTEAETYDSDMTLTASEGEMSDVDDGASRTVSPSKRLTYAEIVKYGAMHNHDEMDQQDSDQSISSNSEYLPEMSNSCGLQASSYGFSASSLTPGTQRRIKT
ncbi:cyclin-I-like [Clavelina lepadiformis]|uniref:Cyclin-like domain-containing protein n=1 Tax=Clavelina lepadiformis TaxID=159417 RepID=A0ABP0H3D2_CLALP